MDPERDRSLTCPTCLGVADYWPDKEAFVCRKCGATTSAKGVKFLSDVESSVLNFCKERMAEVDMPSQKLVVLAAA